MRAAKDTRPVPHAITSHDVIDNMCQHGIRFTSSNYAVWHGYLAGTHPALKRTIDICLSNGGTMDEAALRRLFKRHFCPTDAARHLQFLTHSGLDQLRGAQQALTGSAMPETAATCLDEASRHMRAMLASCEALMHQLDEARSRTELLESFLHDATRDASTDALTGLSNRRAFDSALRAMAGEAMNNGADLAFVLLDIDHFKAVNDRWGHPIGDEVLRLVAGTLMRTVRGGDLVARYGGEEFAVILPSTGRRGAVAVAENVREAVAARPFAVGGGAAEVPAGSLRITVSAGISCYIPGESLGNWLGRADAALYSAKNAGRNRVVSSTTNQPAEWHA